MSRGVIVLVKHKALARDADLGPAIAAMIDAFWREEVVQRGRVPRKHPPLVEFGEGPLARTASTLEIELADSERVRIASELGSYVPLRLGSWAVALLGSAGKQMRERFCRRLAELVRRSDPYALLGWWVVSLPGSGRSPPLEIVEVDRPLHERSGDPDLNEIVPAPVGQQPS